MKSILGRAYFFVKRFLCSRFFRYLILTVVIILFGYFYTSTTQSQKSYSIINCENFRSNLPPHWFQDFVTVPENYDNPTGKKIKVFYYGNIYPKIRATAFYNGGPGSSSHNSYAILKRLKENFDRNNEISFVFIDQRGTGCSDLYPEGDNEEIIRRLGNYGSTEIVFDSEIIRNKILGDQKWNIFGQSYGSGIVHRYITTKPEFINVGFAHGDAIMDNEFNHKFNRITAQIKILDDYYKRYPGDEHKFKILEVFLKADLCFQRQIKKELKYCGLSLLEPFLGLIAFKNHWNSVHEWLGSLILNEKIYLPSWNRYLDEMVFAPAHLEEELQPYAISVIGWIELNYSAESFKFCSEIEKKMLQRNIRLKSISLHGCAAVLQYGDKFNEVFKIDNYIMKITSLPKNNISLGQVKYNLEKFSHIKLYLYSSQFDSISPIENYFEEVTQLKHLPNFKYYHFKNSGHEGYSTEVKIWNDLIKESKLD